MLSKLPFGSFLAAGGLLASQVGDRIIDAYSQLLR
jgi:leader peptidase (prepilin peptidase)/N-methyltransferase